MNAHEQALGTVGATIELSWSTPSRGEPYRLQVTRGLDGGEPEWRLLVGEGRGEVEAWTHRTGDVALVLNLVLSESTEDMSHAMSQAQLLGDTADRNTGMSGSYSTSFMGLSSLTSTNANIPIFEPPRSLKAATMEGNLEDMSVPTLLQSISIASKSGKLLISNENTSADLFFVEGNLTHAQVLNLKGDLAIMELVTWDTGKFAFYRDEESDQTTVTRRVDAILMESVTLLDQSKYLLSSGLKMESYLSKKNPNLTEGEFEEKLSRGAPFDIELQKQFYLRLDGNSTLFDILRERPMVKKDWVPLLFNMIQCELIEIADAPQIRDKASLLQSMALDRNAIDNVIRSLKRPDTGLISYSAFQYFIEQEYFRFQFYQAPFSVVVFEMWNWNGDKLEALSVQAVAEAARRIDSVKRSIDILAHFETLNFALLLPNTEPTSAVVLGHRILEVLRSKSLAAGMNPQALSVTMGIAGIPEDCRDVGLLLSAAKVAKNVSQTNQFPIIKFNDLNPPQQA